MSAVGPTAATLPSDMQDERGREPGHLGDGMADVDDGDAGLIAQPFDVGQDLRLARFIERGQRLVHQQQARIGEQGPANGDALLLAAGEPAWTPLEEGTDAEQVHHPFEIVASLGPGREPAAVEEVLPHREMRKQTALLEDVADPAAMARHEHAAGGVDQDLIANRYVSLLGAYQSSDDVDDRRLAGARPAEQRDQAAAGLETRIEQEVSEAMPDVDGQRHSTSRRRLTLRAISSDASRASIEIATETSVRRSAPASPPGTCVNV